MDNTPNFASSAPAVGPAIVSRIDEVPETYGRLLAEYTELLKAIEYNPYMPLARQFLVGWTARYRRHLWRMAQDFLDVPDVVRHNLPCAADMLKPLQELDDPQLLALARCSRISVDTLRRRSIFNICNKLFLIVAALLALAKTLKELGFDLVDFLAPLAPVAVGALFGLGIGSIGNLLLWYQPTRMVRAFDDIISIAVAARNLKP